MPAHRVRDLTVAIALEGDFAASYVDGDNSLVVATDTMKNTAYALAAEHLTGAIEDLRRRRSGGTSSGCAGLDGDACRSRSSPGGRSGSAPDAFTRDRTSTRTCVVAMTRDGLTVDGRDRRPGRDEDLASRRSRGSPATSTRPCAETDDRMHGDEGAAVVALRSTAPRSTTTPRSRRCRATLLEVFAEHISVSVQASIWIIGRAIVERHPEVAEITMTLPNLHHWLADIERFGLDERPRGVRLDDRAARPHRGDRPAAGPELASHESHRAVGSSWRSAELPMLALARG